ncbi:MAG: uracil-DNA glycosylase [Burkholderiales bacterium]|nr:MAG: uracil-DNA glycosylase [Burkholderiales bacterium]
MSWDDRQRAMLAEMGYRLPARPAGGAPVALAPAQDEPEPIDVAAPPVPVLRVSPPVSPPVRPPVAAPVPVSRAPSGFDTLDLPALREAVAVCQGCGLCEQRRHAVFGSGAVAQASWLVVTDPPDEADDATGEHLGADAGRLLDRMLHAAGQRRSGEEATAFVTPLVKCRPPRGRAPQPAELDACDAVLARQVDVLQPRVVLAMGLQAARRLTGSTEPLGRLRGRVHRWRGLPVVVTFAPGYLLRSGADKAAAWDDLCLAARTGDAA